MALRALRDWLAGTPLRHPVPDALWQLTLADLPFLGRLRDEERARLRALAERFLYEKEFSAAGGLELSEAMCVSIAVQGCLPILNLGLEWYRDWVGVIVYPDEFVIPRTVEDEFGVVHEYDDVASGEAWEGGPLIISWRDAQLAGEGYNVVIHEFVHKLDMRNGDADGIPPLPADLPRTRWEETLLAAWRDFCARVDAAEAVAPPDDPDVAFDDFQIDPYASESPAEFFAVLSEVFFEMPEVLQAEYPAMFDLLCRFYRQNPLARSV